MTDVTKETEFPIYTDDAGVEWTLDVFGGKPVACACDKRGGQIGFALVGLHDFRLEDLPSANRAVIFAQLRADAKAWKARHV